MGGLRPGLNPGLIPGNAIIGGNIELTGGGSIITTGNGNLVLLPNGSGITVVGDAGATSHSLNLNDDLLVTGRVEVDGTLFADGGIVALGTQYFGNIFYLGSVFFQGYSGDDGVLLAPTGDGIANNNLILTAYANRTKDHDHDTDSVHPTWWIHSATDPDTNNTQGCYQRHNTVDAEYGTKLGGIILAPESGNLWKTNQTYPTGKNYAEKMIHRILVLSTISAATATGVTPIGRVTGVALRVSTEITGLDAADHSIALGIAGTTDKYGTVSQGAADDHIHVNKKFHGQGGDSPESAELIITIGGGADQIPTAGAVEIEIHFTQQSALADV